MQKLSSKYNVTFRRCQVGLFRMVTETQPHKSDFGIEELVRMPEEQLNGTK